MMAEIAQLMVNGIIYGSIISLSAIGLSLVYGILNLANFAHGEYLTLGAYGAFFVSVTLGFNLIFGILAGIAVTVVIGLLLDRFIWKPMREKKAGLVTLLIIAIGVSYLLRYSIQALWGARIRTFGLPIKEGIPLLGAKITYVQIAIILLAFSLMFLVHYLLRYTKIGKAMRACSDDIDLARVSGIDVDKVILWMWVIACSLSAIAGIMLGLDTHIRPTMGWNLLLPLFAAVILGGIGSAYGAIAGGMIIGFSQELSVAVIPSQYKPAVSFAIMIAVILVRPTGIFRR
ncbi:MAG: branched-chain amino acid ABC transporter permease [Candidatus Hydrothermarchaeota archaeon]